MNEPAVQHAVDGHQDILATTATCFVAVSGARRYYNHATSS